MLPSAVQTKTLAGVEAGQGKGLLKMTPGFRGPGKLAITQDAPFLSPAPCSLSGPREEGGRIGIVFGATKHEVSAEHKRFCRIIPQWSASFSRYKGPRPAPRPVPAPPESLGGRQEWQLVSLILLDLLGAESRGRCGLPQPSGYPGFPGTPIALAWEQGLPTLSCFFSSRSRKTQVQKII